MGKFQFDGENKLIYLLEPNTEFDAQELYSEWKLWLVSNPDNMKYPQAMRSIGGDQLTPTKYVAAFIEVMNDWKIKPWSPGIGNSYTLIVSGNLFGTNGVTPFIPADDGTVNVIMEVTGNAFMLKGGELSAGDVWTYPQRTLTHSTLEAENDNIATQSLLLDIKDIVQFIKNVEEGNWKIDSIAKQMIFYDKYGNEIMRFNLYDSNGNLSVDEVFERRRV